MQNIELMKTDFEIESEIKDELKWDPALNPGEITVEVEAGNVTLTGTVDSYPKKVEAERAALRVPGVTWVSNCINVQLAENRTDDEIKEAVAKAIRWNSAIEESHIVVKVKNGWVTLEGEVEWEFQKSKAGNLTEDIAGVVGVSNFISIVPSFVKK